MPTFNVLQVTHHDIPLVQGMVSIAFVRPEGDDTTIYLIPVPYSQAGTDQNQGRPELWLAITYDGSPLEIMLPSPAQIRKEIGFQHVLASFIGENAVRQLIRGNATPLESITITDEELARWRAATQIDGNYHSAWSHLLTHLNQGQPLHSMFEG